MTEMLVAVGKTTGEAFREASFWHVNRKAGRHWTPVDGTQRQEKLSCSASAVANEDDGREEKPARTSPTGGPTVSTSVESQGVGVQTRTLEYSHPVRRPYR